MLTALRGGPAELRRARNLSAAFFAVFAPATALADVAKGPTWLAIVLGAIAVLGALAACIFEWRINRSEQTEEAVQRSEEAAQVAETFAASLRTPGAQRFGDASAYQLGVDREQLTPDELGVGDEHVYLERDADKDLRAALESAVHTGDPALIVVRGLPKTGKSRMLFEGVRSSEQLRDAWVLAPRDKVALDALLKPAAPPDLPDGAVVIWLENLELFVGPPPGMHFDLRERLARWNRRVVVVATAGGSGAAHRTGDTELALPIQHLYAEPWVTVVPLGRQLTRNEAATVHARYRPEIADDIAEHGIGEYLVAGPELRRKLEEERHRPGDPICPEGAAVVWAAIDWARAGVIEPIPEPTLRALWRHYVPGADDDDRFKVGLAWALEAPHSSIGLLDRQESGYRPYSLLVAYADEETRRREINSAAWDEIIEQADGERAFGLAIAAYDRGSHERFERALHVAEDRGDAEVAAAAAYGLGLHFEEQNRTDEARTAYQRAIDRDEREWSRPASVELTRLLVQRGDSASARDVFERSIAASGDESPMVELSFGRLLENLGNAGGARELYERAIASGHAEAAPYAELALGLLLGKQGESAAARAAFQRVSGSTNEEAAALAAMLLDADEPARDAP